MTRRAEYRAVEAVRSLERLRGRGEFQCFIFYLGAAWIIYESTALTVDTFGLPLLVVQATVLLLALGALLAIPVARWYQLTARALDEAGSEELGDVPGVPDILEPALARAYRGVTGRTAVLAGLGSTFGFSVFFFLLWNGWAEAHAKPASDPRVSVVVFPFRGSGPGAGSLGEAIGDLQSREHSRKG